MDIPAILERLAHAEGMPADAILAAREQRAAVAPALDRPDRALPRRRRRRRRCCEGALFYAFHLLGEWRETAAYRPLARLLALEEDEVEEILGDAVPETVHRVMAQVFDGDPQPLFEVIEAEHADPFVRSRMLETLAMLVLSGALARDEVARYLRDAFSNLRPHDTNFVWYGWQSAIAALGLKELSSLVSKAFARGLIDPADMSFADFRGRPQIRPLPSRKSLALGGPGRVRAVRGHDRRVRVLAARRVPTSRLDDDWTAPDPGPAINPFRNVGRNDPCPCGSGKKFKQCCLT